MTRNGDGIGVAAAEGLRDVSITGYIYAVALAIGSDVAGVVAN